MSERWANARWVEVADGVLVRRHRGVEFGGLDLSLGLVVGDGACLVVDTGADPAHGAELAAAVRAVTPHPPMVALTHAHFDHCLGTAAFTPTPVWAHPRCAADLARGGAAQFAEARRYGPAEPVVPVVPDRLVADEAVLDVGGRAVLLRHPGRGHTDHDLVVAVPAASGSGVAGSGVAGSGVAVLFAGDLVEQGAPPELTHGHPYEWPATLDALADLATGVIVPGHGKPVDRAFVAAQRAELATLAGLCAAVARGELDPAGAIAASPYPADTTRAALERARG